MKRKLRYGCSGTLEPARTMVEGFLIDALLCNSCGELSLRPEAAKQLLRLRAEAERIDGERKIVRIGNSIGVTLPPKAERLGFRAGGRVDVHVIGDRELVLRPNGRA